MGMRGTEVPKVAPEPKYDRQSSVLIDDAEKPQRQRSTSLGAKQVVKFQEDEDEDEQSEEELGGSPRAEEIGIGEELIRK